ncbi:glycoside hydrolase family 55 protein [Pedobacter mucosus]|uniref:glycoside hydrolase family 55 protein n=1 Tax=Pedobacter mucosus TaxID=2895286 RepID=UPI001EE43966|nr:glycoside hydrolase family 55 protein [Pedobacter mucosus]UKT62406.1 glycoside hydrolase family 55 protein [Pedobacter mucosus]
MKKLIIVSALSALALLSCEKVPSPTLLNELNPQLSNNIPEQQFFSYGLVGDGQTDNTLALQTLIDTIKKPIYLKAGIYIINKTINLKPGSHIFGEESTVIKAGNSMSESLLENGRYFLADRADNAIINRINFGQSDRPYNWKEWNNACIFIINSKEVKIENCLFDFHLAYSKVGMEAVWITGSKAQNNVIRNNKIITLGIKYSENGADYTLVEKNNVLNSFSNALTANGNNDADNIIGCKIIGNTITNSGRMAIEDWGNTDGSFISNNIVNGTGMDPQQEIDGIAISAVGLNTSVIQNQVSNSKVYAIEVRGNYGVKVTGNLLKDNPISTGIILNYTFPALGNDLTAEIKGNNISNSAIGIHIFGEYEAKALITENTLINNINKSISIESAAQNYKLNISKNSFLFTEKTTKERYAIFSYSSYNPGAANQIINISSDTLTYNASAGGGSGTDFGIVIRTDKAIIDQVIIQGNNNKTTSGSAINAITTFGGKPIDVMIRNSKVYGASVDLNGFKNASLSGNNF